MSDPLPQAVTDALDWFGMAHLPDAPYGKVAECRAVVEQAMQAALAAAETKGWNAAVEKAAGILDTGLGGSVWWETVADLREEYAKSIRALREEAP